MSDWNTADLAAADKQYVWHPFTPLADWCAPDHEPLVLVEGNGALLRDSRGREYIDGNSSIWTNIHGHNHPKINAAIRQQLERVAHTSFLGFTNPPAIELARRLVRLFPEGNFSRVFFSDDGSTGIEVALRIVRQYWELRGSGRKLFVAFRDAYHGDTAGAASLGAATMFGTGQGSWNFPVLQVSSVEELASLTPNDVDEIAAVVIEPLVQGAAGMKLWPAGTLSAVRRWCDAAGTLLIVDEVLTGFGRTGKMFACEHEDVAPDILVLGKALTGGYVPLSATLITEEVCLPFCAESKPDNTLFYGHSYTGNPLACASALASLNIFTDEDVLESLREKIGWLRAGLAEVAEMSAVAEVRQCGFIGATELHDVKGGTWPSSVGAKVCESARRHGLLTRPIRNVIVLMPPYCITRDQFRQAIGALSAAILEVCETRAALPA